MKGFPLRHELNNLAKCAPIKVTARSKAWTVFARSKVGTVGSNPSRGMDVWVYSVFVLFCVQVAALRRADPPSKESYQLCID
jgi:hypothetical protein